MSKLIVCLGYTLNSDNSINEVLRNRLFDVIDLCKKYKDPIILLMGSSRYGDTRSDKITEASTMRNFLKENFSGELGDSSVIVEEETKSTVEQLCFLKGFLQNKNIRNSDIFIISSEFFRERVQFYAECILGDITEITFVGSPVPDEMKKDFEKAEVFKLEEAHRWLKGFTKGDDASILKAQREFQQQVIEGKIPQPPIS